MGNLRLKGYLITANILIFLFSILLAGTTVTAVLLAANRHSEREFFREVKEVVNQGVDKEAVLFFEFVSHLFHAEEYTREEVIRHTETHFGGDLAFVFYDLRGRLLMPEEDVPPLFQAVEPAVLARRLQDCRNNGRRGFAYPADFIGGEDRAEAVLHRYRIFPEQDMAAGVGFDYRLSLLRFEVFKEENILFARRVLGWLPVLYLVLAVPAALLVYRQLERRLLEPLYMVDRGIRALQDHQFDFRLQISGARELQSISTGFNRTAQALADSYREIARRERQYRTLIENIPQRVFLKDPQSRYISCNRAYGEDLGIRAEEIAGKTDLELFPRRLAEKYREGDRRVLERGEPLREEEEYYSPEEGRTLWLYTTKTPVRGDQGELIGVLGILFDITERKKREETIRELNENLEEKVRERTRELEEAYRKVERLSVTDALTGMYNRRYFMEQTERLWRESLRRDQEVCFGMLDIDYFKRYNDLYGHLQGDEALKEVAGCIREMVQRPSDIAARYGGEEFVFFLADTGEEGVSRVAERLMECLGRRRIRHEGAEGSDYLTVSLGSVSAGPELWDKRGEGMEKALQGMIDQADKALYRAKGEGRARHVHEKGRGWSGAD